MTILTGLRWLGRGPHRVWKNRMRGPTFGVWHKAYNDTRTGADRTYPESYGTRLYFFFGDGLPAPGP